MTASATPTIRAAYVTNADTCFILFSFFSPIAMDAAALPPIPNMLANAINSIKIGFVRLTAATCSGSPVCPTKKSICHVVYNCYQTAHHTRDCHLCNRLRDGKAAHQFIFVHFFSFLSVVFHEKMLSHELPFLHRYIHTLTGAV